MDVLFSSNVSFDIESESKTVSLLVTLPALSVAFPSATVEFPSSISVAF
jgi:hypothetical protein